METPKRLSRKDAQRLVRAACAHFGFGRGFRKEVHVYLDNADMERGLSDHDSMLGDFASLKFCAAQPAAREHGRVWDVFIFNSRELETNVVVELYRDEDGPYAVADSTGLAGSVTLR